MTAIGAAPNSKENQVRTSKMNMDDIPRLTIGSSAEQVGYCEELITNVLSRMSTRDLVKMSTVEKKWRTLIFNRDFVLTQYRNCPPDSIYLVHKEPALQQQMRHEFQFLSHNLQTGILSTLSFSLHSMSNSFLNASTSLVAASHGLLCFSYGLAQGIPGFVVYNPVTKFLKILPQPPATPDLKMPFPWLVGICSQQNYGKLVIVGNCPHLGEDTITLVFDSKKNSWYKGQSPAQYYMGASSNTGHPLYLNGVIYFIVRTPLTVDDDEEDEELLFADEQELHYKIIGYDVNNDRWCFSIFLPMVVGFPYCLIEREGNLSVLAANSDHDENQLALAGSSRQIRYINNEGDGRFVIWALDIGQKVWTREWYLDLSGQFHDFWMVAASGGVVWLAKGNNSVIIYHMKQRQWTSHRYDGQSYTTPYFEINNSHSFVKLKDKLYVTFEPTFLSF